MHKQDITIDKISKIEGTATLKVSLKNGKVDNLKFIIGDYRRFYTEGVVGKKYSAVPPYLARICGTCSMAHEMASIEAAERALGIYDKVSKQTKTLRTLAYNGTIIRDHALHLYIFNLPDILKIDSVLDIDDNDEKNHQLLHDAFDLKALGNRLSTTVAGAAVHSPYPTVGGFLKLPKIEEVKAILEDLKKSREMIIRGIKLFFNWEEKLIRNTDYVGLVNDSFDFLDGKISVNNEKFFKEAEFIKLLKEIVIPYSQSESYVIESSHEDYLTGALARLNLNKDKLHPNTRKDAEKYLKVFPSNNVFHNCLAQAIEILHCIDSSIEIIENLNEIKDERPLRPKVKASEGIGVIEAPRGTLYHWLKLDKEGKVTEAEVIVPTSQNQINIENDLKKLFGENIDKMSEDELKHRAEMIIRAYDPCMSCATNFLEIEWR